MGDIDKNKVKIGSQIYDAYQESNIVGKCKCGGNLVKKYSPKNKALLWDVLIILTVKQLTLFLKEQIS